MAALPRQSADEAREALREAMVRLAAGDNDALEDIYRATRVKLFGITLRILGDRKEAEDALQDVYINLWQRADRYDPARASPISWLATFARNRAIDRLRTGKVRGGAVGIEEAAPLPDESPLADALLVDAEQAAQIHKCIAGHYDAVNGKLTRLYPGVADALAVLAECGHPLGLCTNKPEGPTRDILKAVGLDGVFLSLVCGDTLAVKKPEPDPLIACFAELGGEEIGRAHV